MMSALGKKKEEKNMENSVNVLVIVHCPTLRNGIILSLAIACRSRGAPVRDCKPAPTVEKNEPMTITHGDGQESVPTTRFFLTASPNLQVNAD